MATISRLATSPVAQRQSSGRLRFFLLKGLLLYRLAAVIAFASVLRHYWGDAADEAHGVALLDYSSEDSSLAAMLRWLNEFWSMPCLPSSALRTHLAKCDPERPFFLWATSWQLLQMQRHMSPVPLPPRAIVIETGGWKKLRFRLGDNKFYRRMSSLFELASDNLCSEFGMCELAAQAYRCGVGNRFAFPVWVQAMISDDGIHALGRGSGRLCVYDPVRIDYPWLLCTEDLVSIAGHGLMRLLGRAPHAPVRGCSDDQRLIINTHNQTSQPQPTRSAKKMVSPPEIGLSQFVSACKKFLSSKNSVATLTMELGSEHIARDALRELLASFPPDWQEALDRSYPNSNLRNWLFIMPSNHSLTGIYPLMFAVLLRLRVMVKLPPDLDFLHRFIVFLNTRLHAGIDVITLSHTDLHIPSDIDAVLCYGSDTTLTNLHATINQPLSGFGTHDTVTVTSLDHLLRFPQLHIRDAFHLARRGCLSSKIIFLVPEPTQKFTATHVKILEENFRVFYGAKIAAASRAQAEAERIRYVRDLNAVFCSTACPALPILPITDLNFEATLPRATFVLPIVIVREVEQLKQLLRQQRSIKTIIQPGSQATRQYRDQRCFVRPGQAGRLTWDGTHEGLPLFAANKEELASKPKRRQTRASTSTETVATAAP